MLLRVVLQRRTLFLLDFLAPSLIRRQSISSPQKSHPVASQSSDTAPVFDQLRKQITFIHSLQGSGVPGSHADVFNNTLVKIHQALEGNDVLALVQHWQYLKQNELLHFLGSSHLQKISNLLAKYFTPESDPQWDVSKKNILEEIALRTASGRSTDALNACMVFNLKKGNPEAVIRLYTRFMELLGEKEAWDENVVDDEKTSPDVATLAADTKSTSRRMPRIPGRVNILLAVITAYAMQDSFEAALQACLATVIFFHDYTTKQFLANFADDPALKQKVGLYVERLQIARMVARPPSLSKHITNVSAAPNTKLLEKLYQAIIDGFTGTDAYLAADPSIITPSKSVALTEVGWTSFLVAFLKCRRRDLASKLWNDMAHFNVKPGVSMWTALLDAYDSMRAVDDAVAAWNMMLAQGIKPDGLTYRALISALFNGRKPEEAMKTFQTFRKESINDCPGPQTLSVYNTVLHGLLFADRFQEADALIQSMHANGPKPDIVSYNTFLAYHGRRRDFKALATLVNRMEANKLVGDVFSFSIILSALLKAGRDDAPDMLLSIMRKQGVQPNVATFSAIIDHQMREQSEKNLRAAVRVLYQMEQDDSIKPNAVTYTSILAGLYRGHWLSVEKAEEWRKDIVKRMERCGVDFTLPTYHILIKSCLEYPHPEGLQHALGYYREMVRRKVPLVQTTWYIMLAGLLQRGEWAVANEIIKDMFRSGIQAGGSLLELVSKIRKRTVR
jgi:pentatricopeptide repeat protein